MHICICTCVHSSIPNSSFAFQNQNMTNDIFIRYENIFHSWKLARQTYRQSCLPHSFKERLGLLFVSTTQHSVKKRCYSNIGAHVMCLSMLVVECQINRPFLKLCKIFPYVGKKSYFICKCLCHTHWHRFLKFLNFMS